MSARDNKQVNPDPKAVRIPRFPDLSSEHRESILSKFAPLIDQRQVPLDLRDESTLAMLSSQFVGVLSGEERGALLEGRIEEANDYISQHYGALRLGQILSREIRGRLERENRARVLALSRILPVPLEVRFSEKILPYDSFKGESLPANVAASDYAGKSGGLFLGARCIGKVTLDASNELELVSALNLPEDPAGGVDTFLEGTLFEARVVLASGRLSMNRFTSLGARSLVQTKKLAGAALDLYLGDRIVARGEMLQSEEGEPALRIVECILSPENPGVLVVTDAASEPLVAFEIVMGYAKLSLLDLADLAEGRVIEFGESIHDPVRLIFENGIAFPAEVVVIGEFFGVTILDTDSPHPHEQLEIKKAAVAEPSTLAREVERQALRIEDLRVELETIRQVVPPQIRADPPPAFDPGTLVPETLADLREMCTDSPAEVADTISRMMHMESEGYPNTGMPPRILAAALLLAAGETAAASVFKLLRESDLTAITFEFARLPSVLPEHLAMACDLYQAVASGKILVGGIETVREILVAAVGEEAAIRVINNLTASLQSSPPFAFASRVDLPKLLHCLANEHPQTVALVLSYLDAGNSALILAGLPTQVQADVLYRIATLARVSPDVIREVERVLERKLAALSSQDFCASGGIGVAAAILENVDHGTKALIIETLEESDPATADELQNQITPPGV